MASLLSRNGGYEMVALDRDDSIEQEKKSPPPIEIGARPKGEMARCSRCDTFVAIDSTEGCVYHPGRHQNVPPTIVMEWSCCHHATDAGGCKRAPRHAIDLQFTRTLATFDSAPDHKLSPPAPATPAEEPEPSSPPPVYQTTDYYRHRVGYNETLQGVALKYNISVTELKRLNKLMSNDIYMKEFLLIPHTKETLAAAVAPAEKPVVNSRSNAIAVFRKATNAPMEETTTYLQLADWNVEVALQTYREDAEWGARHDKQATKATPSKVKGSPAKVVDMPKIEPVVSLINRPEGEQMCCSRCNTFFTAATKGPCFYHKGSFREHPLRPRGPEWSCCEQYTIDAKGCRQASAHEWDPMFTAALQHFDAAPDALPAAAPAPAAEATSTATQAPLVQTKDYYRHRVQYNDTLSGVSLKYNVPVAVIKRLNKLVGEDIYMKEVLLLPHTPETLRAVQEDVSPPTPSRSNALALFRNETGAGMDEAKLYLSMNEWDVVTAVRLYKADAAWEQQAAPLAGPSSASPKTGRGLEPEREPLRADANGYVQLQMMA